MNDIQTQLTSILISLWRRRWYALTVTWLIAVVGWAVVARMPNVYQASTRLYVDTETLLQPLLRGMAVDVNLNQQLEVMQRTLLSRPNLESVMRMTDLDVTVNTREEREQLLKRLELSTTIKAQGKALFVVAHENKDPEIAKKIIQALLTIFVESNLGANRKDMEQARRFIDGQIQQYEQQLRAAEERLAQFKQNNIGMLPEAGAYSASLESNRVKVNQLKLELEEATTRRDSLARQLASVPQFLDVEVASPNTQVVIQNANQRNELDDRITEVEKNLDNLTLRYTEQHPDVVAARRVLATLRQQRDSQQTQTAGDNGAAAQAAAAARRNDPPKTVKHKMPNPVFEQIQIKLVEAGPIVQTLQRRFAQQEADYQRLQEQARTALSIETEFMNFDRDYRVIKKNYEELLGRREAARLGQELDSKSDKVQFRIIDPPTVPLQPSSPNRPLLYSGVLLVAIGAGVVFAFALTQVDDSFATTQRLRQAFALPVLGTVTMIASAVDRRKSVLATAGFSVVCLFLVMAYGGLMLYPLRHLVRSYLPIS